MNADDARAVLRAERLAALTEIERERGLLHAELGRATEDRRREILQSLESLWADQQGLDFLTEDYTAPVP